MASESEDDDNSETYAQRELRARFSKLLEDGHFDGRDMIDDLAEAKKEGHRYFPDEEIELLMSTVGDEKDPPKPPSLPPERAPGLGSCAGWSLFPIASKVRARAVSYRREEPFRLPGFGIHEDARVQGSAS